MSEKKTFEELKRAFEEEEEEEELLFWSDTAILEGMLMGDSGLGSAKRLFRQDVKHQLRLMHYIILLRKAWSAGKWTLEEFDDWWKVNGENWLRENV